MKYIVVLILVLPLYCFAQIEPISKQNRNSAETEKNILFDSNSIPRVLMNSGHFVTINSICISANDDYIISGSMDNTIKLWEIVSGKLIRTFQGHKSMVQTVAITKDNKSLISCELLGDSIKIWDIWTGKCLRTYFAHQNGVNCLCLSPDNKYVLSGGKSNLILWGLESRKVVKEFKGFYGAITCVAYSPDGKYIFAGSELGDVFLWEVATSNLISKSHEHNGPVLSVCFSANGEFALSSGHSKVNWWGMPDGALWQRYTDFEGDVNTVCFTPDNNSFIAASGDKKYKIDILDLVNSNIIKSFSNVHQKVNSICCSNNGKYLISGGISPDPLIWDISTGTLVKKIECKADWIESVCFSPDGNYALSGSISANSVKLWDLKNGRIVRTYQCKTSIPVCFSPNGKYFLAEELSADLFVFEVQSGKKICSICKTDFLNSACFSPDGKYILTGYHYEKMKLWDAFTGNKLTEFPDQSINVKACFSPDGKYVVSGSQFLPGGDQFNRVWDLSGKLIKTFYTTYYSCYSIAVSPDSKNIVMGFPAGFIKIYNIETENESTLQIGNVGTINSLCFSYDGSKLLSASADNNIILWDFETGKKIASFEGHVASVDCACFSPDNKRILSCSKDNSMKLWDAGTAKEIASFCWFQDEWLTYTPDFYFDASNSGGEGVSFVFKNHGYNIDQFAFEYNRPDIILQRLGSTDKDLIAHFEAQHKKRLRKMGLSDQHTTNDSYAPIVNILEAKQIDDFIDLKFEISDSKYNLYSYNVFVNDVPLFGTYGKKVKGFKVDVTEKVPLISGSNKIEVSCLNEKGIESFRALTFAKFDIESNKNLYLLAIGVSKYQNANYNLQYAHKDALDLEKVVLNFKGKGFENVYTKVLTNEQVTPEAIKASKDFVKNAKPDDTFILFIAGHGLHDTDPEATYYYLTSNADLKNLKGTAADFETIEDLLQGIPPRNKLFLMDACESGEIDEEEQGQMLAAATGNGIASRGFKKVAVEALETGTSTSSVPGKRTYLYQKDRYIYNDLVRRSGAIVFSSSKGGELSYERSDIENGLFTEYLMKALTTTEADKDNNGTVSTDELRNYVSTEVSKASGDLQHPTVDRDNIYQKFGFVVK